MLVGEGLGWDRERRGRGEEVGEGGVGHTASAPCLFFHGIQRGKRVAISIATASELSTAMCRGVSQLALRLMLSSSWPASIKNSCPLSLAAVLSKPN